MQYIISQGLIIDIRIMRLFHPGQGYGESGARNTGQDRRTDHNLSGLNQGPWRCEGAPEPTKTTLPPKTGIVATSIVSDTPP